jgi:Protein phosphatase 2C
MVRRIETDEYVELSAEQCSNETQYESLCGDPAEGDRRLQVALGYRRCLDFDEGNHPGQDYATVRIGEGYIVGIVADGVSQSFYGNIAAQRVSQWLLEKLWRHRKRPPHQKSLERALTSLEKQTATEIESVQIPEHIPEIMRTALEKTRTSGSQTVFAAFVSNGKGAVRLYLVGDITAVLHDPAGGVEVIKAPPKGRWSTAGKSRLEMLVTDRTGLSNIVIKSDGMNSDWGLSSSDDTITKDAFEQIATELAGKDDVSFIAATRLNTQRVSADVAAESNTTTPRPDLSPPAESLDAHPAAVIKMGVEASRETINSPPVPPKNPVNWRDLALIIAGVVLGYVLAMAYSKLTDRNTSRTREPANTVPVNTNLQTEIESPTAAPSQQAPKESPPAVPAIAANSRKQDTAKQKSNAGKRPPSARNSNRHRAASSNRKAPASTDSNQRSNGSNANRDNNHAQSVAPSQLRWSHRASNNAHLRRVGSQYCLCPSLSGIYE